MGELGGRVYMGVEGLKWVIGDNLGEERIIRIDYVVFRIKEVIRRKIILILISN